MINTLLVLISPIFRNGSKMRKIKSFRSKYEKNLIRLFIFLDGFKRNFIKNKKVMKHKKHIEYFFAILNFKM